MVKNTVRYITSKNNGSKQKLNAAPTTINSQKVETKQQRMRIMTNYELL